MLKLLIKIIPFLIKYKIKNKLHIRFVLLKESYL